MSKTLNNCVIVTWNHCLRRICRAAYPLCQLTSRCLNTGAVSSELERQEKLRLNFLQEHNRSLFVFSIYSLGFSCHFNHSFIQNCWIFPSRIDTYPHFLVYHKFRPIFERYQSTNSTELTVLPLILSSPVPAVTSSLKGFLSRKYFLFSIRYKPHFPQMAFTYSTSVELSKCEIKCVLSTSELWGHSPAA